MFKHFPKVLIYFFLLVFIIQIICLITLLVIPQPSQAADTNFKPQITIPNSDFTAGENYTIKGSTKAIGEYIQAIYNYSIGIVGILATVVLMFGGISWIVAGGNAERIGNAKAWIGAALTGLALTLTSYVILNTVNPDLVNLKVRTISETEPATPGICCGKYEEGYMYRWEKVNDCNTLDKINYADSFCAASPKPSNENNTETHKECIYQGRGICECAPVMGKGEDQCISSCSYQSTTKTCNSDK